MSKSTKNALTGSGDYSDDNVELIPLMYKMCKKMKNTINASLASEG